MTLCSAGGYCFERMPCRNIDFNFKILLRVQMLSKTLYNLHIYINADYKKHDFSRLRLYCTPAITHLLCERTFAT